MEEFLRRSLLLSQGDPTIFISRPLSAVLLALAAAVLAMVLMPSFKKTRDVAFKES